MRLVNVQCRAAHVSTMHDVQSEPAGRSALHRGLNTAWVVTRPNARRPQLSARLRAIVSMNVAEHGVLIEQASRRPGYGGWLARIV
jgi:hypothetical protein